MYECGALTLARASLLVLMISIGEMLYSFEKIKEKDLKSTELDQPLHRKGKSLSEVECLLQVIQQKPSWLGFDQRLILLPYSPLSSLGSP